MNGVRVANEDCIGACYEDAVRRMRIRAQLAEAKLEVAERVIREARVEVAYLQRSNPGFRYIGDLVAILEAR